MTVTRHVTRESSCPKSCHPKPESGFVKFLVLSPKKRVKSPKETNTKNIRISMSV